MALPIFSRKVSTRRVAGETIPKMVSPLKSATLANIQACQKINTRRRSKMSAVAPAGSPRKSTGRLAAVCMSAINRGDAVSAVISQVPAVSCIQLPRLETSEAIQRLRKRGRRSGAHPESESIWGEEATASDQDIVFSQAAGGSEASTGTKADYPQSAAAPAMPASAPYRAITRGISPAR